MFSKNKLFIFFCISLLSGIFLYNTTYDASFLGVSQSTLIIFCMMFLGIIYYVIQKRFGFCMVLSLFGFILGIIISSICIYQLQLKEAFVSQFGDNQKHSIVFYIKNIYKIGEYSTQYTAKVLSINEQIIEKNVHALLIIPNNFVLQKGYEITGKVKLYSFYNSDNFQYKNYMQSKNIFFKSYVNVFDINTIHKLNKVSDTILKLRKSMLDTIAKIYPKEEALFLGGILIGARENLPQELKTHFNNSGLTHFIAVSGFNITILIVFLSFLIQYFPSIIKIMCITTFIVFFALFVGESAPVIRASIMGLISYYVLCSGRDGNILSIILLTGVIMVVWNPYSINYDVSLHLSFFAVLGIIYTQKFFSKIFSFLPNILEIRTAFVLTLAALSFSLPIMIFNFGQISLLSPFANIAVTWTIPIAMLLGFLSIIAFYILPFIGTIIGYFTWMFLKWDMLVVNFFGTLDWAILQVDFGIYKTHIQILYFVFLIFIILWFQKKSHNDLY